MVSSSLGASSIAHSMFPRQQCSRSIHSKDRRLNCFAIAALAFLVSAVIFAPEQPELQAAICQKHNPAMACSVW